MRGLYRIRSLAMIAALTLTVSSCDLQLQSDSSGASTDNGPVDAAQTLEVADNPSSSSYYTEPIVPYGSPGDGLADNGGGGDYYLASYTASADSASSGLIAGALRHASHLVEVTPGYVGSGRAVNAKGEEHIIVFTADAASARTVPATIEGVPTEVKVTGRIRALGYTGTYRPVIPAGVSVGNSRENSSGTIGAIVVRNGIRYILSNNHVLARENNAVIGEPIVQPGRADNYGRPTGQIGVLSAYKKVSFTGANVIDAAVARLTATNSFDQADQFAPSRAWMDAQVGMQVKKVGRTTGITYGTVQATNVSVKVDYDGQTALFSNQIYIPGTFLKAGDSGSLLVTQDGNNPVGLCFAGGDDGAFANPIRAVVNFFGVRFAGTSN